MHESENCPICRGQPINGSMTDAQFSSFVAACSAEFAEKQSQFWPRISGAGKWHYELADGSITFGVQRYPMIPIGTFSSQYQSWLWAWANEDFPVVARETSRRLQGLYDLTRFQVFRDPGFSVTPEEVDDLVAMAIHQLEAIGSFRCLSEGPTLYLAILDREGNSLSNSYPT